MRPATSSRAARAFSTALIAAAGVAACTRSAPTGFDAAAPEARINAILDAARDQDPAAIPDLIQQLESDDPAVRMFSIRALERITGRTLGYDHAAPEPARRAAVERWAAWYDADMPDEGASDPASPGTPATPSDPSPER